MNLYTSAWIPVRENGHFSHITLESLLCENKQRELSLHRDDMETAALQLLISLVQVAFTPGTTAELSQQMKHPLTQEQYKKGISPLIDNFHLEHESIPFMQSRGVVAKAATPIQKLFIGLPEGNNHAFFNPPGEIRAACPSCTTIALFNQASNCPSFGGGFKANLRGSAPVNTFVIGGHLRETLWCNILTSEYLARIFPNKTAEHRPSWAAPIKEKQTIQAHDIGLLRGLFWQPARIELIGSAQTGICDSCQSSSNFLFTGFNKEKFVYTVEGLWPHPHSPMLWDLKKNGSRDKLRFLSFTTTAPAWTQLNQYLITHDDSIPAHVVQQFATEYKRKPLNLYVSGYRNKQASILIRRHELFSMPVDWADEDHLTGVINMAKEVRKLLRSKLYGFAKQVGAHVHENAQQQFDRRSEPLIHELLTDMTFSEKKVAFNYFHESILRLARELFEQVTAPYRHSITGMENYVKFKRSFNTEVSKFK